MQRTERSIPWVAEARAAATPAEGHEGERVARLWLLAALVAGALTHALFRNAPVGLNLAIWSTGAGAASLLIFGGRKVRARGLLAAGALAILGLAPVVHASDWALGWALPAWLSLLVMIPALVRDEIPFADVVNRPLRAVLKVPAAIGSAAKLRGLRVPPSLIGKAAIGALLGAPFTLAFVLLLSFDDDFVSALGVAYARLGTGLSIVLCTLFWSAIIGVSVAAQRRGLLDAPPDPGRAPVPYRVDGDATLVSAGASSEAPWVSPLTWTLVLGQVAAVLGAYIVVSARHGFGGHSAVREAGETYASYLHAGVLQLLTVAALSVGLVLGGHVLLKSQRSRRLAALECGLLALSAATLGSCFVRIAVYEQAYGATLERIGVAVVAFAVAVVLGLTMVKSLRKSWRAYASTTALALVGIFGAASFFDADSFVAKTNLDRATAGKPLDENYLSSLSSDACSLEAHPFFQSHADARTRVAGGWANAAREHAGWRSFRGLRVCRTPPNAD